MSKKKKRILFDVIATSESKSGSTSIRRTRPKKEEAKEVPLIEREIRLSPSGLATGLVVLLVVVAFAYYVGHRHGEQVKDAESSVSLEKKSDVRKDVKRFEGPFFSIKARQKPYTEFTLASLIQDFREDARLLSEEGFEPTIRKYRDERNPKSGVLRLWVGRSGDKEELERQIDKIRTLEKGRGEFPFKDAWINLRQAR